MEALALEDNTWGMDDSPDGASAAIELALLQGGLDDLLDHLEGSLALVTSVGVDRHEKTDLRIVSKVLVVAGHYSARVGNIEHIQYSIGHPSGLHQCSHLTSFNTSLKHGEAASRNHS